MTENTANPAVMTPTELAAASAEGDIEIAELEHKAIEALKNRVRYAKGRMWRKRLIKELRSIAFEQHKAIYAMDEVDGWREG